jgi:hypothetical protein
MIIAISILSVLTLISGFIVYNLLRKVETLETYVEELETSNQSYDEFYNELRTRIGSMNSYMKNIDRVGSFQSDDETGYVFKELRQIIEDLNNGIK